MTKNKRQPSRSFGPRPHMSTRPKVAYGLFLRKLSGKYRSKPMMKIEKECQKNWTNLLYMKLCKRKHNVNYQQVNVASQHSKRNLAKDSNIGSSNALTVKNSKSNHSLASKRAGQPPASTSENGVNLSSKDFKYSKPSSARYVRPSETLEEHTTFRSKDGSNGTSRRPKQFHLRKLKDGLVHNSNTCPTHLKAMARSVHKAESLYTPNQHNNASGSRSRGRSRSDQGDNIDVALVSRLKGRSSPNQGDDIDVTKDSTKNSKPLKGKRVLKGSKIQTGSELLLPNKADSTEAKRRQGRAMTDKEKEIGHTSAGDGKTNDGRSKRCKQSVPKDKLETHADSDGEGAIQQENLTFRPMKRKTYVANNEDEDDDGGDQTPIGTEDDGVVQSENLTCRSMEKWIRHMETNKDEVDVGDQNPLQVEDDCEGVEQSKNKPAKKRRRYIETNVDDEEVDVSDRTQVAIGDQNPLQVEDDCEGVEQSKNRPAKKHRRYIETNEDDDEVDVSDRTQVAISKDCGEQQWNSCCSKPIDEPTWRGILKIDGKEYISLAAHLSTKSCEKVWSLSRSLQPVVEVTKVSRLATWPKIWETSKPTGDSIGLYFFPHKMRHDEALDELVEEVVENNLALRAVIEEEAEMLIFPSVLLPERYQTFQTKHYLWGAFKPRKDKGAVIAELNGTGSCAQEERRDKQHFSNLLDEVQSEEPDQEMILMRCAMPLENLRLPARSTQQVQACSGQEPANVGLELEAPEEGRLGDASHHAVPETTALASSTTTVPAEATAVAINAPTVPAEATALATDAAALPANHELINSSRGVPLGSVFSIVVRKTPKLGQFIQEMEQEGSLVAVIQGEVIGAGPWPGNMSTTMQ